MGNSYLNMTASTRADKVVRRAKSLCRVSSGNFIVGASDAAVLSELADILNDSISQVLDDFPVLNIVSTDLTATADSASTNLPSTLRNADIMGLEWIDSPNEGRSITMLSRHQVDSLIDYIKSEDVTQDIPDYCYIGWNSGDDVAALFWLPRPAADIDFRVYHRDQVTAITSADVGDEGDNPNSAIVPVPDAMIELLVYCVARRIQERNGGQESKNALGFEARYEIELDKWVGRLSQTPHMMRMARMAFAGYPNSRANTSFNDLSSPNYERY